MFRVSHFMQALGSNPPPSRIGKPSGPVVIWNLVRRCNLTCKHCYSISADVDFPGELNTEQVYGVMDDLKQYGVPVLILSGGEPLLRPDIYDISRRAKAMGFYTALSTNGTLIDESNIDKIAEMNYDYLGISIDGLRETHDYFRQKKGAFDEAMNGIRLCRDKGIKVGLRFTVTQDNAHELPGMLELMNREKIDKFYLSHLNYAGRGDKNRKDDAAEEMTREVMDQLFVAAWESQQKNTGQEFVTGNNDADGVYFLQWVRERFPEKTADIHQQLIQWGGNSSGVNISNIDNLGNVHPDTMWWNYDLGNVKERPFSEIWSDTSDPLMAGLKQSPRPLKGRCRVCHYRNICGGNTRTRAFQTSDDPWWQDPGCYLSDDELGIEYSDYADDKPVTGQLQRRVVRRAS
jgi:heme d1 biosynthesis radical SAM protein NirJ